MQAMKFCRMAIGLYVMKLEFMNIIDIAVVTGSFVNFLLFLVSLVSTLVCIVAHMIIWLEPCLRHDYNQDALGMGSSVMNHS